MDSELQTQLAAWLSEKTQSAFRIESATAAHGGCIHQSYVVEGGGLSYFVKVNAGSKRDVFEAEADGLDAITEADALRTPRLIGCGQIGGHSFLAMERLRFGSAQSGSWAEMGRQLAALHRHNGEAFGWRRDNYIGPSPQSNTRSGDWTEFFREQRLRPQFAMARRLGFQFDNEARLLDALPALLDGHRPEPSLLHGDLWSGNAGFLEDGRPVIYDPASYFGDRETDLAFSEFFGGFPDDFYSAYESAWPLPPGYAQRKELYNLYHVLNHANLFGGGYARQAQGMMDALIRKA